MNKPDLTIEQSADKLRNALKGKKKNEDALMEVILDNTLNQRLEIRKFYNQTYKADLQEDMRKELSGDFKSLCIGLFDTIAEYDAKELNAAIKSLGGDPKAMVEIIGSRPLWLIRAIKEEYQDIFQKDLEKEIEKETSGDFRKMLMCLLKANRSSNTSPDLAQCNEDAKKLYDGGEKTLGTDEDLFNKIFSVRSPHELVLIGRCYYHKTGRTLLEAIDAEFSGKTQALFKTVLYALINPAELYADLIRKAIVGAGTDTARLTRIIVTRHEIDMGLIREFYKYKHKADIKEDIIGDTSGNYRKLLIALAEK